jgi:large subunit ribosomal protein L10
MTPKAVANIPEKKLSTVKELNNLITNKKTVMIASIRNIPASQFQEIGKKLRGKAIVKVPKKNLLLRAIDETKKEETKKMKENLEDSIALLFSDLDVYALAAELLKNKTPAKAKPGQIAPMDIEIPAGPTDLVPGPAISELGALGIQIQIKDGKIEIKEPKVVAKEGQKISQGAADIMSKLDIKPFSIGFTPLVALDNETGTLYTNIVIDTEKTVEDRKSVV